MIFERFPSLFKIFEKLFTQYLTLDKQDPIVLTQIGDKTFNLLYFSKTE